MCGVIGVHVKNYTHEIGEIVRKVFIESEIRGMHATGMTYLQGGKLHTVKSPIQASKFVEHLDFSTILEDGGLYLIGHCRYSTSDLEFNQPMQSEEMCLVHNGVISQEPKENWIYDVEGGNDSMLLLASLNDRQLPHISWPDASISYCSLDIEGTLTAYRNGKRPLYCSVDIDDGVIFTSTLDIAKRAGLKETFELVNLEERFYKIDNTSDVFFWEENNIDLQRIK